MAAMLRILRININLALRAHINMLSMTLMHHLALRAITMVFSTTTVALRAPKSLALRAKNIKALIVIVTVVTRKTALRALTDMVTVVTKKTALEAQESHVLEIKLTALRALVNRDQMIMMTTHQFDCLRRIKIAL